MGELVVPNDMEQVKECVCGWVGEGELECVYSPSNTILGEHVILKSSISLNLILHIGLPFQQLDESGNVCSSPLRSSREREKRDKNTRVNQRPSIRHLSFHPLALPWWSCFYFGKERSRLVGAWPGTRETNRTKSSLSHTPIPYSIPTFLSAITLPLAMSQPQTLQPPSDSLSKTSAPVHHTQVAPQHSPKTATSKSKGQFLRTRSTSSSSSSKGDHGT